MIKLFSFLSKSNIKNPPWGEISVRWSLMAADDPEVKRNPSERLKNANYKTIQEVY